MLSTDGQSAIVFNGLIYNYRELRRELQSAGATFATDCDTEVVLHACRIWGRDALHRFNGMWALCYYDATRQSGFLARDRFGIKPLLWSQHHRQICFASEMPALTAISNGCDEINPESLTHYIRFGYFAHPNTIYKNAHRLPPATSLSFDANGAHQPEKYYNIPLNTTPFDTPEEAAIAIRQSIGEAVARRRVADVPLGAFLSGGLDSSIIVAHLAQQSTQPIDTFSIGWDEDHAYDETDYAKLVSQEFGTHHHALRAHFSDILDIIPNMLDHLGEPFFDSSILPTAMVSRLARNSVTICHSGDGSDELFGGYWRYLAHGFLSRYQKTPALLRKSLERFAPLFLKNSKSNRLGNAVRQWQKLLRGGSNPLQRHLAWSQILTPQWRNLLLDKHDDPTDENHANDPLQILSSIAANQPVPDNLNAIMTFDLQYALTCDMLHKVDLASMFHSLEVRVPFLDPDVVRVAMSIPSAWKLDGNDNPCKDHAGNGKHILRHAYAGLIPNSILNRSKKGFEAPIGEFLRHDLREMFRDTVTRSTIESFGILNYDAVESIYTEHCTRKGEHADLLYALLSLCWWQQNRSSQQQANPPIQTDHRPEHADHSQTPTTPSASPKTA